MVSTRRCSQRHLFRGTSPGRRRYRPDRMPAAAGTSPAAPGCLGYELGRGPSDQGNPRAEPKDDRRQLTAGELWSKGSLVVIDHSRVLPELAQREWMNRCDRGQLAELAGGDEAGRLRVLGQQHLHRRDLAGLTGARLDQGIEHGSGTDQADQHDVDDHKRQPAVDGGAQKFVQRPRQRQPEKGLEYEATGDANEQAQADGQHEWGERTGNPGWNQRDQAGMRRDHPEGQQKRRFGEEGPDQPITPSDQNAQPNDQDDAEVNEVHGGDAIVADVGAELNTPTPTLPQKGGGRPPYPRGNWGGRGAEVATAVIRTSRRAASPATKASRRPPSSAT